MASGKKKVLILVIALIILAGSVMAKKVFTYRFGSAVNSSGVVCIATNSTVGQLIDSLESPKILADKARFDRYARQKNLYENFRPGRYEFKKGMTYAQVINRILGGAQTPVKVTFNNVRTLDRFAAAVASYIEPDSLTMYNYLRADSVTRKYGLTQQTMISMFIPNTYEFYWTTTPAKFVERMKKEYDKFWNSDRMAKASTLGMTPTQVITLASIVYEETKMSDEMPKVAGVYLNRLDIGMPLQADPTVKFGVGDFSIRRVLNRHLEVDSPYNTYKNKGLPPGPICMPSIKAIDAVLNPATHKYLYFCASPEFNGYHIFATSLADHNKNAQAYARALNQSGIYK